MARRILVKGGSGAGKSTLARRLALFHELPYVELDALHHGPNWTAASASALRRWVEAALAWIASRTGGREVFSASQT